MALVNMRPASAQSAVVQKSETSFGLILALWAAGLCAAAQFAKVSLIFPELMQLYPNAGSAAGFLVSLLSFLGVALGLITGIIVARFGYRSLLLCALVFGGLISAYQATLPPFHLMLASRLLEGASHLIIVVAAPTLIAHVSSDRYRAAAMTLWGTFFGVAFALVAWFGLPLVKAYGLASLFIVHAIALMLVAVLLYVMLPREKHVSSDASVLSFSEIIRRHVETYRSAFIAAPAMGWLFYTLSFVSMLTLLPNYVPADQRAFVSGAMPLASIASSMTLGVFLLRHMQATYVIILGFTVSMLCAAFLWLVPGSVWGCIALFAALGLVQGASFAVVPELNKGDQARAYANGAMAQLGNLGNLSGTPLLFLMAAGMEFHGLILFALISYACGIAVHVALFISRQKSMPFE
jgi:MFS transporter, DHA1 family, inner membrane transport protein